MQAPRVPFTLQVPFHFQFQDAPAADRIDLVQRVAGEVIELEGCRSDCKSRAQAMAGVLDQIVQQRLHLRDAAQNDGGRCESFGRLRTSKVAELAMVLNGPRRS